MHLLQPGGWSVVLCAPGRQPQEGNAVVTSSGDRAPGCRWHPARERAECAEGPEGWCGEKL